MDETKEKYRGLKRNNYCVSTFSLFLFKHEPIIPKTIIISTSRESNLFPLIFLLHNCLFQTTIGAYLGRVLHVGLKLRGCIAMLSRVCLD